jgi:hypothetical protein
MLDTDAWKKKLFGGVVVFRVVGWKDLPIVRDANNRGLKA